MRDTIDMAREAGFYMPEDDCYYEAFPDDIKRFEALVRADEREKYKWDIHSCGPTCKRYACVAMREAVEAEREACAKLCETEWSTTQEHVHGLTLADEIRARGNT